MDSLPSTKAEEMMVAIGEKKIRLRSKFSDMTGPGWGITVEQTLALGEARKCSLSYVVWIPCNPFKITELALTIIPDAVRAEISKDADRHFVVRILGANDAELIKLEGDEVYELVIQILADAIKDHC